MAFIQVYDHIIKCFDCIKTRRDRAYSHMTDNGMTVLEILKQPLTNNMYIQQLTLI